MKQLKYVRHFIDNAPSYNYSPYVPKISGFNIPANTSIVAASGTRDSFFHAFLYLVRPAYKNADWAQKNAFVQELKAEFGLLCQEEFMLKLTNSFNINIGVYSRKGLVEHKCVFDYITIFLYFDDLGRYSPMLINEQPFRYHL
jgi:hypothetical protein